MGLLFFVSRSPATLTEIHISRPAGIDVLAMASVIEAEARGEPERCKCLVGEVLKNRADWQGLTINESSLIGLKRKKPSQKSIETAKFVMQNQHEHSFIFFLNPDLATDAKWIAQNRKFKKVRCGGHVFWTNKHKNK